MIRPSALITGDTIAIVAPSGKIEPALVDAAVNTLLNWGFQVKVGNHVFDNYGRFAATVENRLKDLDEAIKDPSIKAILCARGGYGAIQLLPHLSINLIDKNPKWLIGFSDITLLHELFHKSGIMSIHAPMCKHLGIYPEDFASLSLKRILMGENLTYQCASHDLNCDGSVNGRLIGGNLAVMSGLRGTPFDYDYQDKILFIEDVAEQPYKIDRMLYNLQLGGVFQKIKGLVIGQFTDCPPDLEMGKDYMHKIREISIANQIPCCFNFPCGHVTENYPLLIGGEYNLNITKERVELSNLFE